LANSAKVVVPRRTTKAT